MTTIIILNDYYYYFKFYDHIKYDSYTTTNLMSLFLILIISKKKIF